MNKTKFLISIAVLVVAIGGVFAFIGSSTSSKTQTTKQIVPATVDSSFTQSAQSSTDTGSTQVTKPASVTTAPSVPVADTSKTKRTYKYKNGTYTVTGSYDSPAGTESIGVSLIIENDLVAGVSVTSLANDGTSERYIQKFMSGYKPYVIGKNIDSISLDKVSGSSLTPAGFNDALSQIKAQAAM